MFYSVSSWPLLLLLLDLLVGFDIIKYMPELTQGYIELYYSRGGGGAEGRRDMGDLLIFHGGVSNVKLFYFKLFCLVCMYSCWISYSDSLYVHIKLNEHKAANLI